MSEQTPLEEARQGANEAAESFEREVRKYVQTIMNLTEIDAATWALLAKEPGPIATVERVRRALSAVTPLLAEAIYALALTKMRYKEAAPAVSQSAEKLQKEIEKLANAPS